MHRWAIVVAALVVLLGCSIGLGSDGDDSGGNLDEDYPVLSTWIRDVVESNYTGYPIALESDAEQILVSGVIDPDGMDGSIPAKPWLAWLSHTGSLIRQQLIEVPAATGFESVPAMAVAMTGDGGAVVAIAELFFDTEFVLARISESGQVLWDRSYQGYETGVTYNLEQVHQLDVVADGDIRLLGQVGGNNSILALFDQTGAIKWSFIVGGVYYGVAEVTEGYALTGMDKYQGENGTSSRVTVLNADSAGKPTGLRAYDRRYNSADTQMNEINDLVDSARAADGAVYAVGKSLDVYAQTNGILVVKLNGDGSLAWRKLYRTLADGTPEETRGTSVSVGNDGTIHISGRITVYNPENINDDWEDTLHLQIRPDGSVVGGRRFNEKYRSIEIVSSFYDVRMPLIAGNESVGWFLAGIHGTNDGYLGNTRIIRADGSLEAAGAGTPIAAEAVRVDDFNGGYDASGDSPAPMEHTLIERRIDDSLVTLTETSEVSVLTGSP